MISFLGFYLYSELRDLNFSQDILAITPKPNLAKSWLICCGYKLEITVHDLRDLDIMNILLDFLVRINHQNSHKVIQGLRVSSGFKGITDGNNTITHNGSNIFETDFLLITDYTTLQNQYTNANALVNVNGTDNDNGVVVVKIQNLPKASTPGSPTDSYGLVRFRAKVK
jgi:hypothetical protein